MRNNEIDKNLFKKMKKKKTKGVLPKDLADLSFGDDEMRSGSDAERALLKKKKVDFYLDRHIDGSYHITHALRAAFRRHKDRIEWSGQDIIPRCDPFKVRLAVDKLNSVRVWPYGMHGTVKKRRVLLKQFMASSLVEQSMTMCVLGNTVIMCMDFYGASDDIV